MHKLRYRYSAALAVVVTGSVAIAAWPAHRDGEAFRSELGGAPLSVPDSSWKTLTTVLSVTHATETDRGWTLLDRTGDRVHRLSPSGELVASFGGRGDGPGELRSPAGMAILNDTLWVVDLTGRRFDGFGPDGRFARRFTRDAPCPAPVLDDVAPSASSLAIAVRCFGLLGSERLVSYLDPTTGVSVTARPIPDDDPRLYGDVTRLVTTRDGLLTGSMFRRCLFATTDDVSHAKACLAPDGRVPVPADIREGLEHASGRNRLLGFVRQLPRFYPYLLAAVETPGGLVVTRPEGEDQVVLTNLDLPGAPTLRPPRGTAPFVGPNKILIVSESLSGTRIALAKTPPEWR